MIILQVLVIGFSLVAGAPSKGKDYGLGTGGGVGYTDTFRPRFPGVDVRKEGSDGDLLLLKMPHFLEPNPDKPVHTNKPTGGDEDSDATFIQKKESKDVFPSEKMYGSYDAPYEHGVIRDVLETPIVEKTIIKKCDCDKQLEEKHIDVPFEQNPADVNPEISENKDPVVSQATAIDYESYDLPVNPEFGQPPSEETTKPKETPTSDATHSGPIENGKDISKKPNEQPVPQEEPTYMVDEEKQASEDHFEYGMPNRPVLNPEAFPSYGIEPELKDQFPAQEAEVPLAPEQPGVIITPEKPVQQPETPLYPENPLPPVEEPKVTDVEHQKPVYPDSVPATDKVDAKDHKEEAVPTEPKREYDTQYPKKPLSVPETPDTEEHPPVYPQHPIGGPKIPVNTLPLAPKPEENPVYPEVPNTDTIYEKPVYSVDGPENPTVVGVDVKPEVIDSKDIAPGTPIFGNVEPGAPIPGVYETPVDGSANPEIVPETPIESNPVKPIVPEPPVAATTLGTVCEDMGLTKFLYLLNKAGYREMLYRKRPMTIFVPSDAAWNRLPLSVLNRLQRDRRFLRRVLRYHMVDGLEADQSRTDYYCPSMQQGSGLFLNTYGKNMYVNGVPAALGSVRPANGAVYVLSRVLFPFPANTLAEAIQMTGTFTRFFTLAAEAGILDRELTERGPYTLFAPTDMAFSKLPPKTIEWLSWDKEALRSLLLSHLVPGIHYSNFVIEDEGGNLKSVNDKSITFKQANEPGEYLANEVHVGGHDLTTRNGILHSVDEVLFANDLKPRPFVRPPLKSVYG